jgi:hypothetical protein
MDETEVLTGVILMRFRSATTGVRWVLKLVPAIFINDSIFSE